ncbi:MAG: GTPase [Planctomycetota bacterium]
MSAPAIPAEGFCEVLTGPGPAAIATVRLGGPRVGAFVQRHLTAEAGRAGDVADTRWSPGAVRRTALLDAEGVALDDVLVSVHTGPPTWEVRLHLHANPWVVRRCVQLAAACGLRTGSTPPAGLWPGVTPLMADACELLPAISTWRGVCWVLEQVERLDATVRSLLDEDDTAEVRRACRRLIRHSLVVEWFKSPLRVALVGPPNAGKSSLANALGDRAACVVSATPGTTRDWVEVAGEAQGFPIAWLDTAGVGTAADALEQAGIERTRQLLEDADAFAVILDSADPPAAASFVAAHGGLKPACVALSKCDLAKPAEPIERLLPSRWRRRLVLVSAVRREGLERFCDAIFKGVGRTEATLNEPAAVAPRQVRILKQLLRTRDRNTIRHKLLQLLGA